MELLVSLITFLFKDLGLYVCIKFLIFIKQLFYYETHEVPT